MSTDTAAKPMDAAERARSTVDRWHEQANMVAMQSLKPEYLEELHHDNVVTRIYADFMCKYVEEAIRQAEQAARLDEREKALEEACTLECIECAHGDEPAWNQQCEYFYHHEGTNFEVGCTASNIRRALKAKA